MPPRRVMGTALAVLVAASAAVAEEPPHPDLSTEDLRRAGPFFIRPYFLLKQLSYDDNVFFDAAEPVGDVTATLSPGIAALLRIGPRSGLRIREEIDYVAFAEHTGENHWNNHTEITGVYAPRHLSTTLDAGFHSVRARPNLEIDERIRRTDRLLRATVGTSPTRRLGGELAAGRTVIRYSEGGPSQDVTRRRLSRDEDTVSLTASYRVLPKTRVTFTGAHMSADFVFPEERRDSRAWSALVGLRFEPTARIQGQIQIGPLSFEALDRNGDDYRGYVGEARLSGRIGRQGRLAGRFRRALDFSTLEENLYFLSRFGALTYERFLSNRLGVEIAIGDGRNHYPNQVFLREPEPRIGTRDDRIREYEAAVRFRMREGLDLRVGLRHLEIDSTDDSLDRRQNIVGVGTGVVF